MMLVFTAKVPALAHVTEFWDQDVQHAAPKMLRSIALAGAAAKVSSRMAAVSAPAPTEAGMAKRSRLTLVAEWSALAEVLTISCVLLPVLAVPTGLMYASSVLDRLATYVLLPRDGSGDERHTTARHEHADGALL